MALEWISDTQRNLRKWDSRVEHDWRAKWKWDEAEYFGDRGLSYGGTIVLVSLIFSLRRQALRRGNEETAKASEHWRAREGQ